MLEESERYVKNLSECRTLVNFRLTEGMTPGQVIARIREDAERLHQLSRENNRILRELVLDKKPEALSGEDDAALSELANALFHYNRSADCGMAYRIHCLLLEAAKARGDRERIIEEAYYCGITLHYMNIQMLDEDYNLFGDRIHRYFTEGAAFIDSFAEIKSERTRGFIIRCLGNLRLDVLKNMKNAPRYLESFSRAMAVIDSPAYRALAPGLPWDDFAYSMHFDRLGLHVMPVNEDMPDAYARKVIGMASRSLRYVLEHDKQTKKDKDRVIHSRFAYTCMAIHYMKGEATAGQLMESILGIIEHANDRDFSSVGITENIGMLPHVHAYVKALSPEERSRFASRIEWAKRHAAEYLMSSPVNEYVRHMSYNIRGAMRAQMDDTRFCKDLLQYVLACHSATYVHSRMVSFLTERLMGQMIDVAPEALVGTMGLGDARAVREQRALLLKRARLCGLYHDLGKSMVLDSIGLYSRRLLDEEFLCIRQHPVFGKWLLDAVGGMEDCAQAALHHHRSYDGKSGYPMDCPPCNPAVRRIVDIITVCDSLDAATDNVGRSYATCKTFWQLVSELQRNSGTRYSPDVVSLFDDPAFCAELREELEQQREQVYVEVYYTLHMDESAFRAG